MKGGVVEMKYDKVFKDPKSGIVAINEYPLWVDNFEKLSRSFRKFITNKIKNGKPVRILNIAAGSGSEAKVCVEFLVKLGMSPEQAMNSMYLIDSSIEMCFVLEQLGFNNVIQTDFLEWTPHNNMKFDLIIGNPPYSGSLHLDILKMAYKYLEPDNGQLIFVHPGIWLYAQKPGDTLTDALKVKDLVGNKFSSFEIVNGNKLFGVGLFGPCVITHIDNSKMVPEVNVINSLTKAERIYDNVYDINPFFDDPDIFNGLRDKIWKYCDEVDNVASHIGKEIEDGIKYVSLEKIVGHPDCSAEHRYTQMDFYDIVLPKNRQVTDEPIKTKAGKQKQWVMFTNNKDAEQFLDYVVNAKLPKFALMIVKVGQNLDSGKPLRFIPFFENLSNWTDEQLYNKLNLSLAERSFIEQHISEFYNDK